MGPSTLATSSNSLRKGWAMVMGLVLAKGSICHLHIAALRPDLLRLLAVHAE